jgi:hypothetical protein
MIAVGISIFSLHALSSLIKIPGGIHISFSDFSSINFIVITAFCSTIVALVILILARILATRKYSVLLLVVSVIFIVIGVLKIHQNAISMESQYVLEQCQTLAFGVVIESGLTSIGQELSGLGVKADKSKMEKIVSYFGPRCKLQNSAAFALVRESFLGLSLSRKTNFEAEYQTERDNFIDWVNKI